MSDHIERARLLFSQSRYDLAEKELRQALSEAPESGSAHALLALCLSQQKRRPEAIEAGESAVGLAPDLAFCHYALAEALFRADRNRDAARAIDSAIELDPTDANCFALRAAISFDDRDWPAALSAADQGLALDPEHDGCTNLRAMALVQLGRKTEARTTIAGALERDPESGLSHANQGWTLLHQGKPKEALIHFREALRINPDEVWARAGLVEALKARHLIYRLMLGFFLWMGRHTAKMQWVLIIGVFFGQRLLSQIADANPALAPFVQPLIYLVFAFIMLTWMADPLFNLMLRLNKYGRHALRRDQIVASNWLGGCLVVTAIVLVVGLVSPLEFLIYATVPCLVLSAAVAGVFRVGSGWPQIGLAVGVVGLTFLLVRMNWYAWQFEQLFPAPRARVFQREFESDLSLFVNGSLVYFILTNILAMTRPRRWTVE
jgi:tetratricopeptide (TPR) repeat protein